MQSSSLRVDLPEREGFTVTSAFGGASVSGQDQSAALSAVVPDRVTLATNGRARAVMSRAAGRLNALNTSIDERHRLIAERAELLDKQQNQVITGREKHRLKLVLWHLDRIEDAEHGQELDALEEAVQIYERFADRLDSLESEIRTAAAKA